MTHERLEEAVSIYEKFLELMVPIALPTSDQRLSCLAGIISMLSHGFDFTDRNIKLIVEGHDSSAMRAMRGFESLAAALTGIGCEHHIEDIKHQILDPVCWVQLKIENNEVAITFDDPNDEENYAPLIYPY